MSSGSELTFSFFGDCKAICRPMLGLAESACLAWVQSVGWWWRCGLRMECNRSPEAQLGIFWLLSHRQRPVIQSLVRILMIDVPVAQLLGRRVSTQYLLQAMLLVTESLCTSDLVPLRRVCVGRGQVCIFQEEF